MDALTLPPLWPHQRRAYRDAQKAARELATEDGSYGIVIQAPTGAGKTRIALEIAVAAMRKGHQVLCLAPRVELVDQPAEKLWQYGLRSIRVVKHGSVSGDPDAPITVASIQTLLARSYLPPAKVVIFDEARHYVAAEWGKIARGYKSSVRIGLDATPVRADGAPLGDLFDRIVTCATVAELVAAGYLVPCVTLAPKAYQDELSADPVDVYAERTPGRRAIVFCQTVEHARELAKRFEARGFDAEAVDGTTDKEVRKGALRRLATGETKVLTNCNLFLEGVDVPACEVVIVARGCSSQAAWLQMGGRGMRICPSTGKDRMWLFDLKGHVHRFGLLDEARTYHLTGSAIRLRSALPSIVQCRACHAWGRGGKPCIGCGARLPHPPPPRIKGAELVEILKREPDEKKRAWVARLVAREVAKGRSAWRAQHVYRGMFGAFPPKAWMLEAIKAQSPREATA